MMRGGKLGLGKKITKRPSNKDRSVQKAKGGIEFKAILMRGELIPQENEMITA